MARYQYRMTGVFSGASSPGNAIAALFNRIGSEKRITIRSLEVSAIAPRVGDASGYMKGSFGRGTLSGGVEVTPSLLDTNQTVPTGLKFFKGGALAVTSPVLHSAMHAQLETGATYHGAGLVQWNTAAGPRLGHYRTARSKTGASSVERIVIAPGETVGFSTIFANQSSLFRWEATLRVAGGGTLTAGAHQVIAGVGSALFTVQNDSATAVELLSFAYRNVGPMLVTPYLQVVPFAGLNPDVAATPTNKIEVLKMDTAYPDPSVWLLAVQDCPLTPSGAPIVYCTDVGAGAPKGFNYLSTKDLLGPVYRTFFPESRSVGDANRGDTLGFHMAQKKADLLARRAGFVLRPGEGLAVAPAAETVGATAAAAGAVPVELSICFDVENIVSPFLSLTDLQPGSDVVVLTPGGGPVIASVDSNSGTTYALGYDPDEFTVVDVCVYKPGYIPFSIRNLTVGQLGATVPVSQIVDRNYE